MILLQALVNGLVSGTLLAVPAIGFTAMFAVLRFPNFSVSGVATLGAFAGYVAYGAGLQMAGSLPWPSRWRARSGLLFDKLAHLPLVKQGALPAAIASIATGLVLENVVRLGFGNELRGFDRPIARDIRLGEHPRQPAAARDHGAGARAHAGGVRGAGLHPHRQGDARLGRQSRAGGAQGHPARARSP